MQILRATQQFFAISAVLAAGCASSIATTEAIPQSVVREVHAMAEDDQKWEQLVMDGDPLSRAPGFFEEKEALQIQRAKRCKNILHTYGLPTPERVGREVASDFWLIIQHADADPALQQEVLTAIESEVQVEFHPREVAFLTDRVRVNTGRPQLFGSQVSYDNETARAFPKPIEDPAKVDMRRAEAGMGPLVEYINDVCISHFGMNEEGFRGQGITEAYQYPSGFADWSE